MDLRAWVRILLQSLVVLFLVRASFGNPTPAVRSCPLLVARAAACVPLDLRQLAPNGIPLSKILTSAGFPSCLSHRPGGAR
jgi:hypothetical protein